MRETTCAECGKRIDVPGTSGPLPIRCTPCGTARARELGKVRAQERKRRGHGNPQRVISCMDCKVPLEWSGRGRPRERCEGCSTIRNREENKKRNLSWIKDNPERIKELRRRGYQKNVEVIRAKKLDEHYRRKYGITGAVRDRMLSEQGGVCKICKRAPDPRHGGSRLHVDHCHTTGRVRGLLCSPCNTALGLLREDPLLFAAAAAYLAGGAAES